jgi:hypothetical protein
MNSSVSRRVNRDGLHIGGTETTPHQAAVHAASPEGLRFAIECDSSPLGLSLTHGSSNEPLLAMAWRRLLSASGFRPVDFSSANGPAQDVARAIECCRILLRHRAPWRTPRGAGEFSEGETMLLVCSTSWPVGHEREVAELFKEFVAAGWFDACAPMRLAEGNEWNGRRPLHAAAAYLHSNAAESMLEMGVDEREALPPDHEFHTDLLGYAARGFRRSGSEAFVATVSRVLMERSIERSATPPAAAARRRRVARAGL